MLSQGRLDLDPGKTHGKTPAAAPHIAGRRLTRGLHSAVASPRVAAVLKTLGWPAQPTTRVHVPSPEIVATLERLLPSLPRHRALAETECCTRRRNTSANESAGFPPLASVARCNARQASKPPRGKPRRVPGCTPIRRRQRTYRLRRGQRMRLSGTGRSGEGSAFGERGRRAKRALGWFHPAGAGASRSARASSTIT